MNASDVPVGPLLVDTDVVSYWFAQADVGKPFADLVDGHEQAISFATYGELLANAHRAHWGERRLRDQQTAGLVWGLSRENGVATRAVRG